MGIATLVFAGAGLALDVQSVAAANGGGCVNLLAKVELWVRKVSGTPLDVRKLVAKMAREEGCEGPKADDPAREKNGAGPAIEIPQAKPAPKAP